MGSVTAFCRYGKVELCYEPNFLGRRLYSSGMLRRIALVRGSYRPFEGSWCLNVYGHAVLET
jgi:hypothetical protein